MILECPHCQIRLRISLSAEEIAGKRGKCPHCNQAFAMEDVCSDGACIPQLLVVDDSAFFREMIVDILRPLNYTFLTAADASAAWDLLKKQTIALLIVDINMPGENGVSLIKRIRADETLKETPILAISSVYRREEDAATVVRAGADDFVCKSFRTEEFQERVKALVDA